MKFDVDDKNRCRLVCVKFHLNRWRFAVAVAKCLGGSLFWDTVYSMSMAGRATVVMTSRTSCAGRVRDAAAAIIVCDQTRTRTQPVLAATDGAIRLVIFS